MGEGNSATWPADWFDMPLAVFDLETTGKDTGSCRVIEIGIVKFLRGEVTAVEDWLVDPECEIPAEVCELTHISQADVTGKPKFAELARQVLDAFAGCGLVAYNAGFDRTVLTRHLRDVGLDWPSGLPVFDPLVYARHFYPNRGNKLGEVVERLGLKLEGAHRACNDAEATGRVMYAFRDRLPRDVETLVAVQNQWARETIENMRRFRPSFGGNDLVPQESAGKGLGAAYFFLPETDPLRALYATVPAARSKINND